jgi:cysteine-rich repeat protein
VPEPDTELGFSLGNSRTDMHCRMISEHGNVVYEERVECDDGLDNDMDTYTDYPADLGCSSEDDDDEFNEPFCGDSVLDEGEECDDGNNIDGDGCSAVCEIEEEQHVVINEFLPNPFGVDDNNEWIELYNPTQNIINLAGWTIEDNTANPYNLSGKTIPAMGYLVLTHGTDQNFYLNNDGDRIILKSSGTEIDAVSYGNYDEDDDYISNNAPAPTEGSSIGRFPNGQDTDTDNVDFVIFDTPTPGSSNS